MTKIINNLSKLSLLTLICFSLCLSLTACSFTPEYHRPNLELPSDWSKTGEVINPNWWEHFADPTLNILVQEALQNNTKLIASLSIVEQTRARLGLASSNLFPNISGNGTTNINSLSENSRGYVSGITDRSFAQHQIMSQAIWELDFFGKYRNLKSSAFEQVIAAEVANRANQLLISSQTVYAYINLLGLEYKLDIANRTILSRQEALRIYQANYDAGNIGELDLLRAKTEVESVQTALYQYEYQMDNAQSALLLLLGRSPKEIFQGNTERGKRIDQLIFKSQLPSGLPSELLERRPDIMQAEALLRSANFNIGAAKAAWFPSISLTGSLGLSSLQLNNLLGSSSLLAAAGASLDVPIFSFGRIANNIKLSEAQMLEARANYIRSVQNAFKELRDALKTQESTAKMLATLSNTITLLREALSLANIRYDNGYASYLDVLDAQRALFDTEINLATAMINRLGSTVNICYALGGGY